jgi:hypothetical protein
VVVVEEHDLSWAQQLSEVDEVEEHGVKAMVPSTTARSNL